LRGFLSSGIILSTFYALVGLVMFFLVLLVPLEQLKEEERIERRETVHVRGTPEEIRSKFLEVLKKRENATKTFWRRLWKTPFYVFYDRWRIKRYHYHTEPAGHVFKARNVRLTIGKGLRSITAVVGNVTLILLLIWATIPIYSSYHRLAQPPHITVTWIQAPGIVMVLTVGSLLVLLLLLSTPYYSFIGKDMGGKIDISFLSASQAADGALTTYIVESSLDREEALKPLRDMLREAAAAVEKNKTKPEGED
jgi:hypothetical protein